MAVKDRVVNRVTGGFSAYGISFDPRHDACVLFLKNIRFALEVLCEHYDREIERVVADGSNKKSQGDLENWAVDHVVSLASGALSEFSQRVADGETIVLAANSLPCGTCLSYVVFFGDLLRDQKETAERVYRLSPSSDKFKKKRASHSWVPYLVPVAFDKISAALKRTG